MNKSELASVLVEQHNVTKNMAAKMVDTLLSAVGCALEKGDGVSLIGFGTFVAAERKARIGRNPQTGKEIRIAASKTVRFRPGKSLREKVNSGGCGKKDCSSRKKA